jgi:transposase
MPLWLARAPHLVRPRELVKLGHDARLMPPAYVKAYVRRQKNDAADAAAFCEAVSRSSMRFVPLRSLENQAALMPHRVREMLVAQRTQVLNAVRGHLAEIGVIAAQGPKNARDLAKLIATDEDTLRRTLFAQPLRRWRGNWIASTRTSASPMMRSRPWRRLTRAPAG